MKKELIKQKEEWFESIIDDVLSDLSEEDVKIAGKNSDGFDGLISQNGFEKLIRDERVKEIIWPRTGAIFSNENFLLKNKSWVVVIGLILVIFISYIILKKQLKKR